MMQHEIRSGALSPVVCSAGGAHGTGDVSGPDGPVRLSPDS